MEKNLTFSRHFTALCLLFILFDSLLILPSNTASEYIPLSVAAAFAIGFIIYFLELFAISFIFKRKTAVCAIFLCITLAFSAVLGLFFGAQSFSVFVDFISHALFEGKGKIAVGAAFIAVLFYTLKHKTSSILKFALLSAVFTVACIIVFLVANLGEVNYKNLNFSGIIPNDFFALLKNLFCHAVLPSVLLPVYMFLLPEKPHKKSALSGFILAFVFSELCITAPVFLFGAGFTNTLNFPFSFFVSTASVGSLFTRLDSLFYFLSFACALIKVAVCLFVSFASLEKIREICKKGGR